jgi:Flp pilus assembly protein TadD
VTNSESQSFSEHSPSFPGIRQRETLRLLPNWPERLIPLVLLGLTFAVYVQVINHGFITLDDSLYILNNPRVRAGWTPDSIKWAFSTFAAAYWHPLTWLCHITDVQIYGLWAGGHHLTSVLLHLANVLLLFLGLKRMTGAIWCSACVAAIFAWHPLNTESVVWIAERKGVLSTFFWLLTLLAYQRYTQNTTSWKRYGLLIAALALGLMAKPMTVTLPFVLLLLDYWPLKRLHWSREQGARGLIGSVLPLVREKVPLFALAALQSVVTFLAQRDIGNVRSLGDFPLSGRLANALISYLAYIGKMFWPRNLALFYPNRTFIPAWQIVVAGVLVAGITALVLIEARRRPYLFTGWFWYLGALVPVIGIVKTGEFSMADRYCYVSLIGLFIMIVWGLADLLSRLRYGGWLAGLLIVLVLPGLGWASWIQTGYWQDNLTLYQHTLSITSNNYVVHNNLGNELVRTGRLEEGIQQYQQALSIKPYSFETRNSLGLALAQAGRFDEAMKEYNQALRLRPDSVKVYSNLGLTYAKQGNLAAAVASLQHAQALEPDSAEVHLNLGIVLMQSGKLNEAKAQLSEAVRLRPESPEAHNALGFALASQGQIVEAISEYTTALKLDPGYVAAQENLKNAQAETGKSESR